MLYHLSEDNHDGEVFSPRVPHSLYYDVYNECKEDNTHKRVCFSKTKSGAFLAISFDGCSQELYLHVPYNKNIKYKVPTDDQVPDAWFTHEVWVTRKVKMKCIAKVKMWYNLDNNVLWHHKRPRVKIEYIEKY